MTHTRLWMLTSVATACITFCGACMSFAARQSCYVVCMSCAAQWSCAAKSVTLALWWVRSACRVDPDLLKDRLVHKHGNCRFRCKVGHAAVSRVVTQGLCFMH
jgi:hypothetical protein